MMLRPYQQAAVDAVYDYLRKFDDNPCVVIPTAGGKTPILATIVRDAVQRWDGRVMIISHVKELLEQAADKINAIAPELHVGIYSAGLKRRDVEQKCIVAGIQSIFRIAETLGRFDLVIVDEAHMIPSKGEGMYRSCFEKLKSANPHLRVIGLTATPYRMTSGLICKPENILNHICYEVGIKALMADGFLAKLTSKASRKPVDTENLHLRGGEFIEKETQELMNADSCVSDAVAEIVSMTHDRKAVLIFCAGVAHAESVMKELLRYSDSVAGVFGDTLPFLREETLEHFKTGKLKYLVNVGVLTTGFDAPITDCVVLLRPTNSAGLYYQMVGRGFRLYPTKENCLILDFAGNIERLGPVDLIEVSPIDNPSREKRGKTCPECREVITPSAMICPACGHHFISEPKPPPELDAKASQKNILSGEFSDETFEVKSVRYCVHVKRDAPPDTPRTMRIEYSNGLQTFSEWVCPEHIGYARQKFIAWWQKHAPGCELPRDAEDTVSLANEGALEVPESITVRFMEGERYPKILNLKYKERPAPPVPEELDEIPF